MAQFHVEIELTVKAPANTGADHWAREKVQKRIIDNLPESVSLSVGDATLVSGRWEVKVILTAMVTAVSYSVIENGVDTKLTNLLGSDRVSWQITKIEKVR